MPTDRKVEFESYLKRTKVTIEEHPKCWEFKTEEKCKKCVNPDCINSSNDKTFARRKKCSKCGNTLHPWLKVRKGRIQKGYVGLGWNCECVFGSSYRFGKEFTENKNFCKHVKAALVFIRANGFEKR